MILNHIRRSTSFLPQRFNFATLILAEHFEGKLNSNIGSILTASSKFNDPNCDVLIHGENCDA